MAEPVQSVRTQHQVNNTAVLLQGHRLTLLLQSGSRCSSRSCGGSGQNSTTFLQLSRRWRVCEGKSIGAGLSGSHLMKRATLQQQRRSSPTPNLRCRKQTKNQNNASTAYAERWPTLSETPNFQQVLLSSGGKALKEYIQKSSGELCKQLPRLPQRATAVILESALLSSAYYYFFEGYSVR